MAMEFDADGRIILPNSVRMELDKEKRGIILTKTQVSLRSPAIAQLKIAPGKEVPNPSELMYEMKRFCDAFSRLNFSDVNKNITFNNDSISVEAKESLQMYSFLSGLVGGIRERFSTYPVAIKGSWEKGDN